MRALDQRHVPYETFSYPPEVHSAGGVAAVLGVPAGEVYKTLVVRRERGRPVLAIIPGDRELALRVFARAIGEKAVAMATQPEAERLTGLQVGGISALALLGRGFDVYLDKSALSREHLFVSAGKRGLNLRLRVADLIAIVGAKVIECTSEGHN